VISTCSKKAIADMATKLEDNQIYGVVNTSQAADTSTCLFMYVAGSYSKLHGFYNQLGSYSYSLFMAVFVPALLSSTMRLHIRQKNFHLAAKVIWTCCKP